MKRFSPSLLLPNPESKGSPLPKAPTGIRGLDEVTGGGLPRGRPTLLSGAAGCGKTVFAMEFLVRGIEQFGEPGVFVSFEESPHELIANFKGFGFDLERHLKSGKLFIEHIRVDASEQIETGQYDLGGLFVRLDDSVGRVGAKRIALDTLESLFAQFADTTMLRSEFQRLFTWVKSRGLTAIVTAERGTGGGLSRSGLEEYVADAVLQLDHRVNEEISTRRLRVVKYRGSLHGTNEYPFLIEADGISVLPVTSAALEHGVSSKRVSTGLPSLDAMLAGKGFFKGSSILISGTPGTGKTSLAATIANAACRRGERVLFFAFEESPDQVTRNLSSVGLRLEKWQDADLLRISASRPATFGLETHLSLIHRAVRAVDPAVVIVDPLTDLRPIGTFHEVRSMTMRLVDELKVRGITAVFTAQSGEGERNVVESVSSLMDAWIDLRSVEHQGRRHRLLSVIKARGMEHSQDVRALSMSKKGLRVESEPFTSTNGTSARAAAPAFRRPKYLGAK